MAEANDPELRIRPAAGVPARDAERLRLALQAAGLLDTGLAPAAEDDRVWFPLLRPWDPAADPAMDAALAALVTAAERRFRVRDPRPTHYRDRLGALDDDVQALLPTSYDIIGHIAIIKLPEPLIPHQDAIGQALLQTHPNLRTVARDDGVTGPLRVRDLTVIAGTPELVARHREHGLTIEVPVAQAYFSPRLATERMRLATHVRPGERVLDLFAGVGALVCLLLRDRDPAGVTAIDLNPAATAALLRNLDHNRLPSDRVDVRTGDARAVAPRTQDWDHVVMNLPHDAESFLDVAMECVAPTGRIHLYMMVERSEERARVDAVLARLDAQLGGAWGLIERRHVRNYAPTMDGLGLTFGRI